MSNLNLEDINFSNIVEKPPERPPGIGEGVEPIEFFDRPGVVASENSEEYNQYLGGPAGAQAPPTPIQQHPPQIYLPQPLPPQGGNFSPPIQATEISLDQIDLHGALLACEQAGFSRKGRRRSRSNGTIQSGEQATAYSLMEDLLKKVILRVKEKQLYYYTGTHYEPCSQQQAERLIVDECRPEVAAVGTSKLPKDVYAFLLMEPEIAIDEASPDEKLLTFYNGLLDLDTGKLSPHDPQKFTTFCLNCYLLTPDVPAICPAFERFLSDITGGDMAIITRIWEIIGYCLTQDIQGKVMFVFQGVPNSGKSLLSDLISSFFPSNKVSALDIHALRQQFAMSELEGKALCISPDLPNAPLDTASVSNLKKLTGRDVVSADKKYSARKQFKFTGKIIAVTNYPLLTTRRDDAFEERVVAVPFLYSVAPNRRKDLLPHLLQERSAIAKKALAAYFELRKRNYRFSGFYRLNQAEVLYEKCCHESAPATQIYRFAQQYFTADPNGFTFMDDAYSLYSSIFGSLHINAFSMAFSSATETLFGAAKVRKRKANTPNAMSCLQGIRMKEGGSA